MRAPLGVRGLSGGASSMGRKSTARCVASGVRGWIFSRGRLWVGRSRHGDRGLQGGRWGALVGSRCRRGAGPVVAASPVIRGAQGTKGAPKQAARLSGQPIT